MASYLDEFKTLRNIETTQHINPITKKINEGKEDWTKFKQWCDEYSSTLYNLYMNNKNRLQGDFKQYSDIYYVMKNMSPEDLENALETISNTKTRKDKEQEARDGATLLYSGNGWKVYKIDTYNAAIKYGKHTEWCITGVQGDGKGYWEDYENDGVQFYFYINNYTKYALAMYPNGDYDIWNEEDYRELFVPDAPKVNGLPNISEIDYNRISMLFRKDEIKSVRNVSSEYLYDYAWEHGYRLGCWEFTLTNGEEHYVFLSDDTYVDTTNNNDFDITQVFDESLNESLEPVDPEDDLGDAYLIAGDSPIRIKNYLINQEYFFKLCYYPNKNLYVIIDPYMHTHFDVSSELKEFGWIDNLGEPFLRLAYSPSVDYMWECLSEYSEENFKHMGCAVYNGGVLINLENIEMPDITLVKAFGKPIKQTTVYDLGSSEESRMTLDESSSDDFETIAQRETDKLNKFLDQFGFEMELINDYEFENDSVGMFLNSIQDNASVFPIALNKDSVLRNGDDLYLDIKSTLAHECGHGIFEYLNDIYDLEDLDEETVVEEFARDYCDNMLEHNELYNILLQYSKEDLHESNLSQEQINYFKNSKIRDKDGNLLVCYHGTPNPGFKEFNPTQAKSQFGDYKFDKYNVNYFTTNRKVAQGYTSIGTDEGDNIYACYLNVTNPYIVDNSTESDMKSWNNIKDKGIRERELKAFDRFWKKYCDKWLDETDLEEINRALFYFNCVLKPSSERKDNSNYTTEEGYYDLYTMGDNTQFGSPHILLYAYSLEELFDSYMYEEVRDALVGDFETYPDDFKYTIDNLVKFVILMNETENTNYDGIIIPDIMDIGPRGSAFMDGVTTDIVTLNSSNQIKLIDNVTPTSSGRIDEETTTNNGEYDYKEVANDIMTNLRVLADDYPQVEFIDVEIVDDWGDGCDVEAEYYDENEYSLAWLVVRVYKPTELQNGINFRQIETSNELQGKGFANDLVEACLKAIDKNNKVLVHMDLSGGFWSHMKSKHSEYNWDKSIKTENKVNESLTEDNDDDITYIDDYSIRSYVEDYVYTKSLDEIMTICGITPTTIMSDTAPMFILPDGRLINCESELDGTDICDKGRETHQDFLYLIYDIILKKELGNVEIDLMYGVDVYALEEFADTFKLVRLNPGTNSIEHRFYCVIPTERPTDAQFRTLLNFFELGDTLNRDTVLVLINYGRGHHYYKLGYYDEDSYTGEDIIKKCKNYYGVHKLVEDNNSKVGYRNDELYNSGVIDLKEIITYEILELSNSDIPETLLDKFSDVISSKEKKLLNNMIDKIDDGEFNEDELPAMTIESSINTIMNIINKKYPNAKYGLWLGSRESIINNYEGNDDNINAYNIECEMPISDLGFDDQGCLFVYTNRPTKVTNEAWNIARRGYDTQGMNDEKDSIYNMLSNILGYTVTSDDIDELKTIATKEHNDEILGLINRLELVESNNTNTNSLKVYHGSDNKFDEFRDDYINWFTTDKEYAKSYGKNVYECNISFNNPIDVGELNQYLDYVDEDDENTNVDIYIPNCLKELADKIPCDVDELVTIYNLEGGSHDEQDGVEYLIDSLYTITNSSYFRDLLLENNYDCIIATEDGIPTYGILKKDNINTPINEQLSDFEKENINYHSRGWIDSKGKLISTNNAPHYEKEHKVKDSDSSIRFNFGYERYIGLPLTRPTENQLLTLRDLLDYYFINQEMVGIRKTDIELNYNMNERGDFKTLSISSKDYTSDEVIKLIKRLYNTINSK